MLTSHLMAITSEDGAILAPPTALLAAVLWPRSLRLHIP